MRHRQDREPKLADAVLCWEPDYTDAVGVLDDLRMLLTECNTQEAWTPSNLGYPRLIEFVATLQSQVDEVREEHALDLVEFARRAEQRTTRVVNEEQLQGAVTFLTGVMRGEITDASMEQIAAARCFMRAE